MQEPLTPGQLRVLRVIATGATNAEAAEQLGLKTKTVESHMAEMLSRAGAKNRTQLVLMALQEGLINVKG